MIPNPATGSIRRNLLIACFAVCSWLAGHTTASAQMLGAVPIIAGVPVQCNGVPTVVQPIPDIAMAGGGLIVLNPRLFGLPGSLQLFIYAHECAHHIQGANEGAADCWAIRTGCQQGWFRESDIAYLVQYLR